jgi:hypothetical protein
MAVSRTGPTPSSHLAESAVEELSLPAKFALETPCLEYVESFLGRGSFDWFWYAQWFLMVWICLMMEVYGL